jgi:phosphoenolpyruvate synthase/pyruvate phosphate dikinase
MAAPDFPPVVWLGDAPVPPLALVGEKVAVLSRLAVAFPVPPGFCLTTAGCQRVMSSDPVPGPPAGSLHAPALALLDTVEAAYRALAQRCGVPEPVVAVSPSVLDTTQLAASLASQPQAMLNVQGSGAVVAAVQRCCAATRPAAGEGESAVLVQQMAPAETAAVVFSANPLTGNRDEVVIHANWGLGASLVGGAVTPDIYIVSKANPVVFSVQLADKARMTVAGPEGAYEVAVPDLLRRRLALIERQIAGLAQLAVAVETELGHPVEIECACQGEALYLLRCRPIVPLSGQ